LGGRVTFGLVTLAACALVALAPGAGRQTAGAAASCDAFTPPTFRGEVPTGRDVLGFDLGSQEVTAAESDAYVAAVDAASPRIVSGVAGHSVEGRPLTYAIVGKPENVTPTGLAAVQSAARTLEDPATPAASASALAASSPAILWIAANVHGSEESGTDAALRVLYELADRSDCAAAQILDNAIVVLLPIQNPDGREAERRQNSYGFDMNRDWFARTQPETDAKVDLVEQFPPVLFIDDHEMGTNTFFFPPNADPVYHEVSSQVVDWINGIYGAAMQAEFKRQKIPFFNGRTYDFFGVYYGDTVPANGFQAAGMTFEKYSGDPISVRTREQYVAQWTSISQAALNKQRILTEWHQAWVDALAEGQDGQLEPNGVVNPKNAIEQPVPTDPVRNYFIRADDPAKAREVQELARRLQRMEVDVYRLTRPLAVADFHPYGRPVASATLPTGTYWIPLAQRQKHWVQAMLNETTYPPVNFFYDVSAWSQPLLFNVAGGFSGATVHPSARLVAPLAEPASPTLPANLPRIGLLQTSGSTAARESSGWLRYLFDREWHVPFRNVTPAEIASGGLADVDVLVASNGNPQVATLNLGKPGKDALRAWVNGGGRFIGFRGGTELAARLGLTTARLHAARSDVPGSLFRVAVAQSSPLAAGVGRYDWALYDYDDVMTIVDGTAPVRFPVFGSQDFFVSGFARGEEELGGTAAVADEPVGAGRLVLFTTDPNYRAWTKGMQRILWNALFGADPWPGRAPDAGSPARAADEAAAVAAAEALPDQSAIRLSVHARDTDATQALIRRYTTAYTVAKATGKVTFLLANPDGLAADEHPFIGLLSQDLVDAGIAVVALRVP
jgi:hypothetical protein